MLAGVILCAGESSRMGFPKALVEFRGKTFLEHLLEITHHTPEIGCTRVVVGAHAEQICARLDLNSVVVIFNPNWKSGQLSSIQAALGSLPKDAEGIVLFLVDHPLVRADVVETLIRRFHESGSPIVLPTCRGKRGHPVIFARRLYSELLAAPNDVGARAVVWAHAAEVLEVPTEDEGVTLNLNDPETLRRALEQR